MLVHSILKYLLRLRLSQKVESVKELTAHCALLRHSIKAIAVKYNLYKGIAFICHARCTEKTWIDYRNRVFFCHFKAGLLTKLTHGGFYKWRCIIIIPGAILRINKPCRYAEQVLTCRISELAVH